VTVADKHIVWYLEMRGSEQLVEKQIRIKNETIDIEIVNSWEINKNMYIQVGAPWKWTDRLVWSDKEWQEYASNRNIETILAFAGGKEIGYAELRNDLPREVQIEYFGLLPDAMGKGYGGHFLSRIVKTCWMKCPGRVWVHTCSDDAPHALANYLARGFKVFDKRQGKT
jgi:GNAT superfamily N-acetyltransferase